MTTTQENGPLAWEDFGFDNMVDLKTTPKGTVWEGWWTKTEVHDQYGASYTLKDRNGTKVTIPGRGQLKFILERDFQIFDYIRVTYEGVVVLKSGTWRGKDSHQFKVQKAIDWCGEKRMYEVQGLPIPSHLEGVPLPQKVAQPEKLPPAPEPVVVEDVKDPLNLDNIF